MIFQTALIKSFQANCDRVAVEQDGNNLTYAQLFRKANAITASLFDKGAGKETMVGACVYNRADMIVAMIGIMNAGCVFVPIDPKLPDNRLAVMIDELKLNYVVTAANSNLTERFKGLGVNENIKLEDTFGHSGEKHGEISYPEFSSADSIYVYFTSGTTGKPKGVVGANASLLQFVQWEIEEFDVNTNSRFSQLISPYFDAFLRDVFVPLLAGGTVCLPPVDEDFFTSEKLIDWVDKSAINYIHCVPSVFRLINSQSVSAGLFGNLKYVMLSGERIVPAELKNWYDVFGANIQLVNFYGATETTMIRAFYRIQPADSKLSRIPIGAPISDTELLILQDDFKPCGTLVTGTVYIATDYMTKGYLNNPELTNEKFITLELPGKPKVKAFKTGDKARKLANGKIELIGRDDRQVKLRGIRIELDEIENTLMQAPFISRAVVICNTDNDGNQWLTAFVVKTSGWRASEDITSLAKDYLEQHLPEYAVPASFTETNEIPLLSNGKINYKELATLLERGDVMVEPANSMEEKVLTLWKEILGDKAISTDVSFHAMGGNSLSIMKLIARIYKEFQVRITLNELFNNLTVQKQAALISACKQDDVFTITKANDQPSYPLSASQERMYYNYELDRSSTAYNLPIAWDVEGELDMAAMQSAVQALLQRHEGLRTEFKIENGNIRQVIHKEATAAIEEITVADNNTAEAIANFIRPFNLNNCPLFRCGVISQANNKKVLVFDIHHIVCDGISQVNIFSDFLKLYKGEKLQPLALQYKDYAQWEHNFRFTNDFNQHREYWLKSFEGQIPKIKFPVAADVNNSEKRGGNVFFEISKDTLNPVFDLLGKSEVTNFSTLFSLFSVFLSQFTGQDDIVIGINSAGRIQEEMAPVVGMFVKTLPIRQAVNMNVDFKSFAVKTHQNLVAANTAQVYDLSHIYKELNKKSEQPIESLFDVVFVFQNFENKIVKTEGLAFSGHTFDNNTFKYPITLFASDEADAICFRLEYAAKYFSEQDVNLLVDFFKETVEAIAANVLEPMKDCLDTTDDTIAAAEEVIAFNF